MRHGDTDLAVIDPVALFVVDASTSMNACTDNEPDVGLSVAGVAVLTDDPSDVLHRERTCVCALAFDGVEERRKRTFVFLSSRRPSFQS